MLAAVPQPKATMKIGSDIKQPSNNANGGKTVKKLIIAVARTAAKSPPKIPAGNV